MVDGVRLTVPTTFTDSSLPVLPTPPTILTSDSFNRADTSPGSMGSTDAAAGGAAGLAWSGAVQAQIQSNQVTGPTISTPRVPRVNVGVTDMRTTVKVKAGGVGAVARCDSGGSNYYQIYGSVGGSLNFQKIVGGASTSIGTAGGSLAAGDILELSAQGSIIQAKVNGLVVAQATDTSLTAGTYAGIAMRNTSAVADDFVVYDK